jgi:nucleotide-binding universal stress UspA family protein
VARPGSDVEVVHVMEPSGPVSSEPSARAIDVEALWKAAAERAQRKLERMVDEHIPGASAMVVEGTPAAALIGRAVGRDLVIVGQRSDRSPLMASVMQRVVRHAPCSVLVVKPHMG